MSRARKGFIRTAGATPAPERKHGTYVKYVIDRCRCFPCRVANARYVTELATKRRLATLPWRVRHGRVGYRRRTSSWQVVSRRDGEVALTTKDRQEALNIMAELNLADAHPDPVWASEAELRELLAHIRRLGAAGVGHKAIARKAGMSVTRVHEIVNPRLRARRGRPVRRWVKRTTMNRILAVTLEDGPGGAKVPPAEARRLIRCLFGAGVPRRTVAAALRGYEVNTLQVDRYGGRVRMQTVRDLRDLHGALARLWPAFRERCGCEIRILRTRPEMLERAQRLVIPKIICGVCGEFFGRGLASHVRHRHPAAVIAPGEQEAVAL